LNHTPTAFEAAQLIKPPAPRGVCLTEQAAREQVLRRYQADVEKLQRRLDVLYEDRLDERIDAARYDRKASEIHEEQQRIRNDASECRGTLPPAQQALDLIVLTTERPIFS
jgi:hypothetical protein